MGRIILKRTGQLGKRGEEQTFSLDRPAPTVQKFGLGDQRADGVFITGDDGRRRATTGDEMKPPYRVPSMAEIAPVRGTNGLTVVSTFSGCGGSCLGFEMAGYQVLWANEFVPAAADTYRANHPDVHLDTQDIRTVTAASIREVIGDREIDVFEGSPPCESFSTSGSLSKGWGEERSYSDGKRQVMDDLFYEFARLLRDLRPRVFVAENVSGLARGVSKGYFKRIHEALAKCGYRVEARMLDAQWLGVPQVRRRVIFMGVREDLTSRPVFPRPLDYRYTIREAIFGVHSVIHDTSGLFARDVEVIDKPCPTITNGVNALNSSHFKVEDDLPMLHEKLGKEWDKLRPGEASEKHFDFVRPHPDKPCPTVVRIGGNIGVASVVHPTERRKFTIAELRRICGFPDDFILTGSYAQQWERLGNSVPPPMMRAIAETLRDEILRA